MENRTVNGWDFEFVSQNDGEDRFYQCRGEVLYDDDHDEQPEPSLLSAAYHLAQRLERAGEKVEVGASEKGWVEVNFLR
jgi:hypothetical protein